MDSELPPMPHDLAKERGEELNHSACQSVLMTTAALKFPSDIYAYTYMRSEFSLSLSTKIHISMGLGKREVFRGTGGEPLFVVVS